MRKLVVVEYINNENGLKGLFERISVNDGDNKIMVASGFGNAFDYGYEGFIRAYEHLGIQYSVEHRKEEVTPQMMFGKIEKFSVLVDFGSEVVDSEGRTELILENSAGIASRGFYWLENGMTRNMLTNQKVIIQDGTVIWSK